MKTKREITAREYEEVASRLTDAINGNTYFFDSISGEGWRFTPSVMVYWHTDTLGSGEKETRMENWCGSGGSSTRSTRRVTRY